MSAAKPATGHDARSMSTRIRHALWRHAKVWRQRLRPRPVAQHVFVAGMQRSGTNLLMDVLDASAATQVFHETDPRAFERYVVIDSSAAQAYLFDGDKLADSMRVVIGSPKTKTPMMAVLMRDAKVHPYWNVPPELIRSLTAKRIGEQGLSYLDSFHYEVLANWSPDAPIIDPATVNWKQIASGAGP